MAIPTTCTVAGTTPSNDTVQPPQTSAEISSEQNSPLPGTGIYNRAFELLVAVIIFYQPLLWYAPTIIHNYKLMANPTAGTTPSNGAVQPPVTSPTSAELSEEQNSPLPGTGICTCIYSMSQKKAPFPFRFISRSVPFLFPFQPFRSVPFRSLPLTVYRGQTVLALGMNSSAKFTACVGEA